MQEITAASEEQSAGVGQINAAVNQLSTTTQQNASSSEQLAATAEEMSGQAEQLQQSMSFFKLPGTAHSRAAASAIASIAGRKPGAGRVMRTSSARVPANLARAATVSSADVGADAVDESQFERF